MRRRPLLALASACLLGLAALGAARIWAGDSDPSTWYVSPTGSDSASGRTPETALGTVTEAVSRSRPGDSIEIASGDYPISGEIRITTPRLSVHAESGTVFNGTTTIAAQDLRREAHGLSASYRPMPATLGEGLQLNNLPPALTGSGGLTHQAQSTGWACVTGPSKWHAPAIAKDDPVGCGARPAVVIAGYFPDQAWIGNTPLRQVTRADLVTPGTFYVARKGTDGVPAPGGLLIHPNDAERGELRVSRSSGNFIIVAADGVSLSGFTVVGHSPSWSAAALTVVAGVVGTTVSDVRLVDIASTALKLQGSWRGGSLIRDTAISRVGIERPGWVGAVVGYTDDTIIESSTITEADAWGEFRDAPQRGGLKATKNHRLRLVADTFSSNSGHGLWLDQSNYDVTIARSRFMDNTDSAVFFEISHGLTLVDNLILGGARDASVRLAGSSGLRLVNNTIVGGTSAVAILADARSARYPPDGRPCSEHPARYSQPGDLASCAIEYPSDLDRARPGEFGPGQNQTPGLTWRPGLDLMINNVLAASGPRRYCRAEVAFCVRTWTRWRGRTIAVAPASILHPGTELDGNAYQLLPADLAQVSTPDDDSGALLAADLPGFRAALAAPPYDLDAESNGVSGTHLVTSDGRPTSQLMLYGDSAAPVPVDPEINRYVPAGSTRYGTTTKADGLP